MTPLERVPPHDLAAERQVLGTLLLEPAQVDAVAKILTPVSFYANAHAKIYAAIVGLCGRGEPVDLVTVTTELRERGDLDRVGGAAFVSQLLDQAVSTANAVAHARAVADLAARRALRDAG